MPPYYSSAYINYLEQKRKKKKYTSEDRDYEGKPSDVDEYVSRNYDDTSIESHIDSERSEHGYKQQKRKQSTRNLSLYARIMISLGLARVKQNG